MTGAIVPPGSLHVSPEKVSVHLEHPGWHPWLNQNCRQGGRGGVQNEKVGTRRIQSLAAVVTGGAGREQLGNEWQHLRNRDLGSSPQRP